MSHCVLVHQNWRTFWSTPVWFNMDDLAPASADAYDLALPMAAYERLYGRRRMTVADEVLLDGRSTVDGDRMTEHEGSMPWGSGATRLLAGTGGTLGLAAERRVLLERDEQPEYVTLGKNREPISRLLVGRSDGVNTRRANIRDVCDNMLIWGFDKQAVQCFREDLHHHVAVVVWLLAH